MIDAREARIVFEENEYKNDIRDILEAQKKAEKEQQEKVQRLKKMDECDVTIQPIYDCIAEASADGYNEIVTKFGDYNYSKPYLWEKYGCRMNVRPLFNTNLTNCGNLVERRHSFTQLVKDVLEAHGYEVEITRSCWGYNDYDEITIKW